MQYIFIPICRVMYDVIWYMYIRLCIANCEWCVRGNFVAIIFYLLLANYYFLSHVCILWWLWIFRWGNPLWLPFHIILVGGWGIVFIWVDHEGIPYVIRYILVDGWDCHYGIRFNQCGNVNHSFSTIFPALFIIIIPFSIRPNTHALFWQQMGMEYNPDCT